MVACIALHEMQQVAGKMICELLTRVRAQIGVCKFLLRVTNCETEINYTEPIIWDFICHGIADSEI